MGIPCIRCDLVPQPLLIAFSASGSVFKWPIFRYYWYATCETDWAVFVQPNRRRTIHGKQWFVKRLGWLSSKTARMILSTVKEDNERERMESLGDLTLSHRDGTHRMDNKQDNEFPTLLRRHSSVFHTLKNHSATHNCFPPMTTGYCENESMLST